VAESFLDDGQVGAAGKDPGGVGVAQVVEPDADAEVCLLDSGQPDLVAEPVAGDVAVGVDDPRRAGGFVLALSPALGSVGRDRGPAADAPAASRPVGARGAVAAWLLGSVKPSCSGSGRARSRGADTAAMVKIRSSEPSPRCRTWAMTLATMCALILSRRCFFPLG
jgi:hypothetical protein